jgi:hypothetical protein
MAQRSMVMGSKSTTIGNKKKKPIMARMSFLPLPAVKNVAWDSFENSKKRFPGIYFG